MSNQQTILRRLTDPSDRAMEAVERIYVESLPAAERKPVGWLRDIVAVAVGGTASGSQPLGAEYHVSIAERAGAVAAFAILFIPESNRDAALLEYLAVDEPARGGGLGGLLLQHCIELAHRPMLVEVETGDLCAHRRRRFYQTHGCRTLAGLRYLLPLPNAGPMELMVAGVDGIPREDLLRSIKTLYTDVYGQSPDDPRLALMARDIEEFANLPGQLWV